MERDKIFLVGRDRGELIPMEATDYTSEDELQAYLARYPDLLAGHQINPDAPRRWLLVAREMGVPGDEGEADRWSLDHLFLDQDGIPTFVECKRASDTRTRREVVAQMLDYAANGTQYWPIDRLRQDAAETAQEEGKSLDAEIRTLTGNEDPDLEEGTDIEDYWGQVEANLRAGNVRLVFVADEVPKELRRLVEFMNEKMADVEVLAITIKQYQGEEINALVPQVIGLTQAARDKKRPGKGRKAPTDRLQLLASSSQPAARFLGMVLDLAEERGYIIYWASGFSVRAFLPKQNRRASFVYGWPTGFEFYFGDLRLSDQDALTLREQLLQFGVFRERGKKTLRADLDDETLPKLEEVYNFILDRMDDIAPRY